jgi:hypothetical protein
MYVSDAAVAELMAEEQAKLEAIGAISEQPTPSMLVGYVTADDQHWFEEMDLPLPKNVIAKIAVLSRPQEDRFITFELEGVEIHHATLQPMAIYLERGVDE